MSIVPPTFAVEVAFSAGANPSAWTLGLTPFPATLGESLVDVWTDITEDVETLTITRGRSRELEEFRAGRCHIVLDNEGREYDPLNLAGPYVSGGVTQIKPGRRIRVKATHPTTAVEYPLYQGLVRDWLLSYTEPQAEVSLVASDLMEDLANVEVDLTTTEALSGTVFTEVADEAGLARHTAAAGISTLQATAYAGTAMALVRRIEQSEVGWVYVDPEGVLTFADRHTVQQAAASNTSQATFVGPTYAGDLKYAQIELDYDSALIRNSISLTRAGGTAQTAEDADSITAYGKRSLSRTALMNVSDAEVDGIADYLLDQFAEPSVRVRSITFAPMEHADLMTQALDRDLLDRVTVHYQPPGGGSAIEQDLIIVGIDHAFTPPGYMSTTLRFELAPSYYWRLGVGELGDTTGPTATVLAA